MEIKNKYQFNYFRFFNDSVSIAVSFVVACDILKNDLGADNTVPNLGMLVFMILGWYISSLKNKLYNSFNNDGLLSELYKILNNISIQFFLVIFYFFSIAQTNNSKKFLIIYIGFLLVLIPLEKLLYRKLMIFLHRKGINKKKILIVGAGRTGMDFFETIKGNKNLGYEVLGFLDDEKKPALNGQYLGDLSKIEDYIHDDQLDEVVVALPNRANEKIKVITSLVRNYPIKLSIIPSYHDMMDSYYRLSIFGGFPVLSVREEPLDDVHMRSIKRLFDIVFSIFAVIFVCSWLFPIIAIAIKLDSKGPVFFIQERWGRKNKKIKCFKFRSMRVAAPETDATGKYQQAKKNDSRITRVGKILRKTNLDEFPQFINVLLGEMSIVGPRPHPNGLNLESIEIIDNYTVRHLVKPGITGWAQINGLRGETAEPSLMRARIKYDIWYIENWSLMLDFKIIFITFWKTIIGDKDAF